jgi:hypothetical protein
VARKFVTNSLVVVAFWANSVADSWPNQQHALHYTFGM